jgi:hypothetical protein
MENSIPNAADLQSQIITLKTALDNSDREKALLKNQLGTITGALEKLDFVAFLKTIENRLDASEQRALSAEKRLREELTARIAMSIEPYLEKTVRRVNDLNENIAALDVKFGNQQKSIEERFVLHEKSISAEGDKLIEKLVKSGDKIISDWKKAQNIVQHSLVESIITRVLMTESPTYTRLRAK